VRQPDNQDTMILPDLIIPLSLSHIVGLTQLVGNLIVQASKRYEEDSSEDNGRKRKRFEVPSSSGQVWNYD
jgi:hypothetical protein